MSNPPCILTIAGSDSGGGAGIQADLKTITVLGAFGLSAITALTSQNGLGVNGIHAPEPAFVSQQIKTVTSAFPIAAAKTGMLFSAEIIDAVQHALSNRAFHLVVDPVCVSQSGQRLLREDAVSALKWQILPLADLLTPNIPEAELLTGLNFKTPDDALPITQALLELGSKAVLLKGGHVTSSLNSDYITDWLALPNTPIIPLTMPKVNTSNNHGTGCTLSAAIATYLGFGCDLQEAITKAQTYLNYALSHAYAPGLGTGPPNHGAWITRNK